MAAAGIMAAAAIISLAAIMAAVVFMVSTTAAGTPCTRMVPVACITCTTIRSGTAKCKATKGRRCLARIGSRLTAIQPCWRGSAAPVPRPSTGRRGALAQLLPVPQRDQGFCAVDSMAGDGVAIRGLRFPHEKRAAAVPSIVSR